MEINFALFVALTVGITEVIKRISPLAGKFIPLIALFIGVLLSFSGGITVLNLLQGLVIGLTASGIWSGTKHLLPLK